MESPADKKTRIKRALGQLKEVMVKKRVSLPDEKGYNLIEKSRDGDIVKYRLAGGIEVKVVEPPREITL